jgi:hypothetical protein
MMKGEGFLAYLGYKIVVIQIHLQGFVSLIEERSGNTMSVIESTRCINEAIIYSRISDVGHDSEELFKCFDRKIKISLDKIL